VAADAAEALGHESLPDALAWALVRRAVQRCGVAPWSGLCPRPLLRCREPQLDV